ncbi:MAG: chemotaxis protein CheA [Deltaproteobacteria bacterium]|nr:chemotaxis protein CheA [Deltaproteobacteria bacterium]
MAEDIAPKDEMDDIVHDFIVETTEILDGLDQRFVELEKTPESRELLNAIFRSVHTIKGAAGFLGFRQVVDVAHTAEGVLNRLRQATLTVTPSIMDALLKAVDMLKLLLSHVKAKDGKEEDISVIMALLNEAQTNQPSTTANQTASTALEPRSAAESKAEAKTANQPSLTANQPSSTASQPSSTVKEDAETIRVDIKRLDSVLNMVGELVLGKNRLARLGALLEERYGEDDLVGDLMETASHLNLITTDLHLAVMKTRMQPIGKVFGRFPRMVRDLARERGKEITLVLNGEETEVDKTVIEEIGDPLVHLVRNAVDHGIDTPEERASAGKLRAGTLTLSAYHKGNNIFISIEDDGRGMNTGRIREKALEKGVASKEELDRMSEREILNFIFLPGFSTASVVTNVSGRGVGMDVVKTNITKLNGSIEIDTVLGRGTVITLRLPLTLAIIQAIIVRVHGEAYALPLASVVEIIRISESEIQTVEGREVIYSRGTVYPLRRLANLLNAAGGAGERSYAVLITLGEKTVALLVDELLGREEMVIKSTGEYLSDMNMKGVSGATITGDGGVVFILDVIGLFTGMKGAPA